MSNVIKIFENEEFGRVRTVIKDGEPWFVGKDVTEILGYSESAKAIRIHVDKEDKGVSKMDTPGGRQNITIINESGLYSLILSSKMPRAKEFKRWVTSEILPTIRRTGGYVANEDMFVDNYLPFLDDAYRNLFRLQMIAINQLNERIRHDKPLVEFANQVAGTDNLIDMNAMAKLAADEHFDIGRTRLFRWLKRMGVLMSNNLPYQQYITEQGKYSSKYALTELLICGHCGTPYRRTTWSIKGTKQIVWRCISRLEHGKKYCPDSATIKEEQLHEAIIRAINNYYSCRDDIARILKANIGTVLERQGREEIIAAENRLKEIDQARNDLVGLIATGGCDEDKLDSEFAKLHEEEQSLSERLTMLKAQNHTSAETQEKLDKIMELIDNEKFELEIFDNVLIRKLIECVKVLSKTEILVIFKGGYEVRAEIE